MWNEQVEFLKKDYHVLTLDFPWHGRTTGRDTNIYIKDIIKIVLDSFKIKDVFLAGLSMGSVSAQDFAIAYPDRVKKLILLAPGVNGLENIKPLDSLSITWYPKMMAALEEKDTVGAAQVFTKAWAEGPFRNEQLKSPASVHVYNTTLWNMKHHKLEGWPRLVDQPKGVERISEIRKPVLIVHGDKDLPYINVASLYLEKNIPSAKRILLKDVAHMFNLEKPQEVNSMILEFLKSK